MLAVDMPIVVPLVTAGDRRGLVRCAPAVPRDSKHRDLSPGGYGGRWSAALGLRRLVLPDLFHYPSQADRHASVHLAPSHTEETSSGRAGLFSCDWLVATYGAEQPGPPVTPGWPLG